MSFPRIVVVGSLNLDLVVQAARLPLAGETIHGTSLQQFAGGKGGNQAVAAARLGARVSMVGRLGNDPLGLRLREALRKEGVDEAAVHTTDGSSGTALITTGEGGENTIVVIGGANRELSAQDVIAAATLIGTASMVLAQLEVPLAAVEQAALICEEGCVPLLLDPAPACRLPGNLLRRVSWLTPNRTEAATLLGHSAESAPDAEICARLLDLGCRNVLLKSGSAGVFLAGSNIPFASIPAPAVQAVDTTAAGDCFNGAFAVALVRGDTPAQAARWACVAAALSVTRAGAQPSLPNLHEVEDFLQQQTA